MAERNSFEISIIPNKPQQALEVYVREPDADKKAELLNTQLIVVTPENIATPGTIYTLMDLVVLEEKGITQYRPDSVSSLTHENLLAVVKNLAGEQSEEPVADYLAVARQIQGASKSRGDEETLVEVESNFSRHIFEELAERLKDEDPREAQYILAIIENNMTPSLLREITANHPEVLSNLILHAQEFSSPSLRDALTRLKEDLI